VEIDSLRQNRSSIPLERLAGQDEQSLLEWSCPRRLFAKRVSDALRRSLSDRVQAISVVVETSKPRPVGSSKEERSVNVEIGLILNPENAPRLVDHGPSADDEAACEEFRSFWGEKSELRRFKDGSIQESVVWEADVPSARAGIVGQIVNYVLNSQFGIAHSEVRSFVCPFDRFIEEAPKFRKGLYVKDPRETGFSAVLGAFDSFVKTIKGLEGLPLEITHVAPIAEGLRYSSIFVPGPRKIKQIPNSPLTSYVPLQDVLITFETSPRWPEDLEAVQKVKAAFLAKISELLVDALPGTQAEVAFDVDTLHISDNVSLEVLLPSGFAFRARIYHAPERTLLERRLHDHPDVSASTRLALDLYHSRFEALPRHHAAMSSLQHVCPSFSPAVRLLKRWLSSHCLSPHISAEAVELVVASVYLPSPDAVGPYESPASGATGFARALERLASWDWRSEPLLVPAFSSVEGKKARFSREKAEEARKLFVELRKADVSISHGAWVICTEEDAGGRVWTGRSKPGKMVAQRIKDLAKAALKALSVAVGESGGDAIEVCPSIPIKSSLDLFPTDAILFDSACSSRRCRHTTLCCTWTPNNSRDATNRSPFRQSPPTRRPKRNRERQYV
jgi:U3 small nucleolar RNA-associated protein 22